MHCFLYTIGTGNQSPIDCSKIPLILTNLFIHFLPKSKFSERLILFMYIETNSSFDIGKCCATVTYYHECPKVKNKMKKFMAILKTFKKHISRKPA